VGGNEKSLPQKEDEWLPQKEKYKHVQQRRCKRSTSVLSMGSNLDKFVCLFVCLNIVRKQVPTTLLLTQLVRW
jgi:hypothetical protein